jgi:hypothetical protein
MQRHTFVAACYTAITFAGGFVVDDDVDEDLDVVDLDDLGDAERVFGDKERSFFGDFDRALEFANDDDFDDIFVALTCCCM